MKNMNLSSLNQTWLNQAEFNFKRFNNYLFKTQVTYLPKDSLLYNTIADSILIKPDLSGIFLGVYDSTEQKSLYLEIYLQTPNYLNR